MKAATHKLGGQYGCPETVDGLKKAIYQVCESNFKFLENLGGWRSSSMPLFDVKEAGCFKCEHCIKANETKSQIRHFCTDPKCVSQKKAAFTWAKNAQGMALKKAEQKAIKQAVDLTRDIDRMRMLVVLMAQVRGRHVHVGYGDQNWRKWLFDHLQVKGPTQNYGDRIHHFDYKVMEAAKLLTTEELAKLLVAFALYCLSYEGDILNYKIETTEALNLLGITPLVEDPQKE